MTMRKHKTKQNVLRLPAFDTSQLRTTLEWQGKLLGVGSMVDEAIKRIKRHARNSTEATTRQERLKALRRLYHASGGKQGFDIPIEDMTALDKARIERARSRREWLQVKRARAYAWCVNNNPALHWPVYEARVRISNVNYVDKAFLMKWRGRPA